MLDHSSQVALYVVKFRRIQASISSLDFLYAADSFRATGGQPRVAVVGGQRYPFLS